MEQLIQQNPKLAIVIIGLIVSFVSIIVTKYTTNQKRIKELKEQQKEKQKLIKEHRNDPQKVMELNKEMMKHTGEMMKHSMKPALITLIPLIFLFAFLRQVFADTIISGSWIWYYIITAIIGSIIFRKLLKVN